MAELLIIVGVIGFAAYSFLTQEKVEVEAPKDPGMEIIDDTISVALDVLNAVFNWSTNAVPEYLGLRGKDTLYHYSSYFHHLFVYRKENSLFDEKYPIKMNNAFMGGSTGPHSKKLKVYRPPFEELNKQGVVIFKQIPTNVSREKMWALQGLWNIRASVEREYDEKRLIQEAYASIGMGNKFSVKGIVTSKSFRLDTGVHKDLVNIVGPKTRIWYFPSVKIVDVKGNVSYLFTLRAMHVGLHAISVKINNGLVTEMFAYEVNKLTDLELKNISLVANFAPFDRIFFGFGTKMALMNGKLWTKW